MPPFYNPQSLPVPRVSAIDQKSNMLVASTVFRLSDLFGGVGNVGPLNKPYLELASGNTCKFQINQLVLSNNYPNFGTIRSLAYVFRPDYDGLTQSDYDTVASVGVAVFENLCKIIVYDNQTASQGVIEANGVPWINSTQGSTIGFYVPRAITVQGCVPFFGQPSDQIDVCVVSPSQTIQFGKCELRFYNFDVAPFNHVSYGPYVTVA